MAIHKHFFVVVVDNILKKERIYTCFNILKAIE